MVLQELVTYIAVQVGTFVPGTNLFYGPLKEFYPDTVCVIQEYGGMSPEPNMGDVLTSGKGIRLEYPSVQVTVRGPRDEYDATRTLIENVYTAFAVILNQTLSGVYYVEVEPVQSPFFLRTDENFRNLFVFNARVTKEKS